MKHLILILTIIFVNAVAFSQCEVPGGDFEEFVDISSSFEYYVEIEEPILSSPHFTSFGRALFLGVLTIFYPELATEEFYRQLTGMYQYQPGANGTASAFQLKPDALLEIADASATFNCDSIPIALKGSYLHVGQATDSAFIFILFGDSILADSYEVVLDDTTFTYAQIGAAGELTITGGDNEYTEFEVPITKLDNEFVADSVFLTLVATSDPSYLEEGNESYYVFDELRFVYDEQVAVNEYETFHDITIFPNPVANFLYINGMKNNVGNIKVFDPIGRLVLQQSNFNFANQLSLNKLNKGVYFLDIQVEDFTVRKKIIKL